MNDVLVIIPTYNEIENIDRIISSIFRLYKDINILVVDDNYDNYASKIHLYQYVCKEIANYIYIYYTGKAKTNLEEFEIDSSIENNLVNTYGFEMSDYEY